MTESLRGFLFAKLTGWSLTRSMKNIKRTLWIAIVVGAFTLSAFAVDLVPTSESLLQKVEKKNEVRTELPQAVKSAVISKYVAYAIEQFSFEENSVYKLILKGDRNKLIVYYTADGEYLSQETVKTVQMVALI